MRRRELVLLSAASTALVVGVIGCASDYTQPSGTIPTPVADGKPCVAANNIPVATTPPGTDAAGSTLPTGTVPKPAVSMPVGPPPTELKTVDIKVGTGPEAKMGDNVTMNYIGVSCSSGKQFDSSYDSGEPFSTTLQEGSATQQGVIKGWVEGVAGMKVGGVRQIIIPPDKAYGDNPPGDDILPGESLVFVVELLKAETPPATTTTAAPAPGASTTAPASESPGASTTVAPTPSPVPSTTVAPKG